MGAMTFAVCFGNRGFFPETLIASARQEMRKALEAQGHTALMMDADATRFGAVETPDEGQRFAQFLKDNRDGVDGVILCLPNFGDETGAVAALRDAGVPILIQAYPDELDKMGFAHRRDAFCGKLSVMDVLRQYGVPFTTNKPHTVHPLSTLFGSQLSSFAATCRVVKGMRRMNVGAIGARTTAFKTIRFDELALQRRGVSVETFDLSELFRRTRSIKAGTEAFAAKTGRLAQYTNWKGVPDESFSNLAKLSMAIDDMLREYSLDAVALRCWIEIEKEFGVSPCVLLSELNDRGIPAACEMDVCNAVAMKALNLASTTAPACLDWNNNYGDDADKCILFHCGPVPQSMMTAKGDVIDHPMFAKALGAGCGFGCNVGRIAPRPMTFASMKTENGDTSFFLGEGEFTSDPIPEDFFGCAGVARINGLQEILELVGQQGYRHHVSVTNGHSALAVREALTRYLGYKESTP